MRELAAVLTVVLVVGTLPLTLSMVENQLMSESEFVFEVNGTVLNQTGENETEIGIFSGRNLGFGRIPQGSGATKFLELNAPKRSEVLISVSGNISERLEYDRRGIIEGDVRRRVRFNGSDVGFYEGSLTVKTMTPRDDFGKRWLEAKQSLPLFQY